MHELGIAESAVSTALRVAHSREASRIHAVTLRIGVLTAVDPDSLRFAFGAVTKDTIAEGAVLTIETIEALAHCPDCDLDFAPGGGFAFACPQCGQFSGQLKQGRELDLARLELS